MHGSRKSALDLLAAQLFVFQQLLSASTSSDSAVELLESDNFLQVVRRLWDLDEETLGERASFRESAASKDDLLSSVEGFLTSTVVKQTLKKQLDTIMASNAQSTAVLERLLADSKEMAELKRIEAEEQREKAEAERFKNPGTAIWSNPYAKTTEDPALAKRRIMSTFVVEELLADVIFASAFDRIAAIETQREDEQRACDMEVEQQRKFDEECKKQQIEQLQKDLAAQNDADAGAGAGARGKKGNLRDNTAIKTLRKMFQASHMFQASVDKDGGEAGAAANAMAGSGDEDDDGEEEEDDSNVVIVSDSDE